MNKVANYALVGALMVGSFGLGVCTTPLKVKAESANFATFLQVYDLLKSEYVEQNIKDTDLVYGAIRGMLGALDDPYTRFMDPKAFQSMQDERQGSFGGIGIQIGIKDGKLTVIAPMEDTPAYRAGLKAGDHIFEIDGKPTHHMAEAEAVSLIRGARGTKVVLTLKRHGVANPLKVSLVRDNIVTKAVKVEEMDGNIGYIRLSTFMSNEAGSEVKSALDRFRKKDGIILDLRGNPGGLLPNAVDIGSMFIKDGPIVQLVNREGEKQYLKASGRPVVDKALPVVVLVDGGSASASEILAGALQDNKRATLVGTKTFGKGLVQTVHPLSDGSGVAITTQKYLTSAGHDINKKGVMPDIVVELPKIKLDKQGNPDPVEVKKLKDTQLERAKAQIKQEVAKRRSTAGVH
ncbi:MAG: S41 family peptidase [Candidatus Sericytochromatia bacterium]|nr:S41 family peptidase [Candidatus Sericytochromatia bacterium]